MALLVEVCVQGVSSALAAGLGGADRLELCEDLSVGGVTPSAGQIAVTCSRLAIPVHVLIRPRAGDFVYSDDEFEVMRHDVLTARALGAAGVVLGLLKADRSLDRERTEDLVGLAQPMKVTFHRAFDVVADPRTTLDDLIAIGVGRVLTSGGQPTASGGLDLLAALQRRAGDRLIVLAGGGVTLGDLPRLAASGLREVHCGSATGPAGSTESARVRTIVAAAHAL